MKAAELMTRDPIVVPPEMTVQGLVQLLAERHISGVFVADAEGKPLGVVTEADLVRRLDPDKSDDGGWFTRLFADLDGAAERYAKSHGTTARDLMTALIAVDEDTDVAEVAHLMREKNIRRVGVLRGPRLVGVVSRADMLKAVAQAPAQIASGGEDAGIQRAILGEMRKHGWADTTVTTVIVEGGVVRLEGYCRSDEARGAMRVLAENVAGVKSVVDHMAIAPSYPAVPGI